jgi:hypothetical protein
MKDVPYPLHIGPALVSIAIVLVVWVLLGNA